MSNEEKKGKILSIVAEIIGGKDVQAKANKNSGPQPLAPLERNSSQPVVREGEFDIVMGFRQTLKQSINVCGKDRFQIIAEMGYLMTNGSLDHSDPEKWVSKEQTNSIPAEYLPAFCHVTGSIEPLRYIAESLGYTLIEKKK